MRRVARVTVPTKTHGGDWRDTLRDAGDLAVLGFAVFFACLLVITGGGAVAAASAAVHDWTEHRREYGDGRFPSWSTTWRRFRRAILPGLGAGAVALALCLLVLVDIAAVRDGLVPGGPVLLAATTLVGIGLAGFCGLTAVEVGRADGAGWRAAAARAGRTSLDRPVAPLSLGAVMVLAVVLSVLLPMCAPILAGYVIFALHAVATRVAPMTPTASPRSQSAVR
jgi:hypothetical protein